MTTIKPKDKKPQQYSMHHILCKSRFGSNNPSNLEYLKDNFHRSLHTLFQNQMIAEQLITTVNISAKALRDDVRERLLETLNQKNIHDPYEWYVDDAII